MPTPDLSILQRSLQSDEDVEAALHVLAWLAARRKSLAAACELKIAEARRQLSEAMRVEIEGETFTFDDARKSLEQSICRFADAQRDRLFTKKKKTVRFRFGEIRLRKRSARVALAAGETVETVLPRVQENPRYVRTKQELDLVAIRTERQKELITDEQLAQWGLQYDAGSDALSVRVVESEQ